MWDTSERQRVHSYHAVSVSVCVCMCVFVYLCVLRLFLFNENLKSKNFFGSLLMAGFYPLSVTPSIRIVIYIPPHPPQAIESRMFHSAKDSKFIQRPSHNVCLCITHIGLAFTVNQKTNEHEAKHPKTSVCEFVCCVTVTACALYVFVCVARVRQRDRWQRDCGANERGIQNKAKTRKCTSSAIAIAS